MTALGIPVEAFIETKAVCYDRVYLRREYHIYTDAWTFDSRNPSDYYEIFYSKYDGLWGNYIGYYSHEFDYWFEKFVYATTMEEALE
ncbi:hypothetical protein GWN42_09545, partial [candidate division KSB1 bacterium]|nr:hypothetical protein [candidate division KSB1 bacterium]